MATATAPNTSEIIAQSKQATEGKIMRLLATLSFVPDDKLNWSPSPGARTPLQIVAHCGGANMAFASLLRGEGWKLSMDAAEASAQIRNADPVVDTREAAVKLLEDSGAALAAALDNVTPEMLGTTVTSAFGPLPFTFLTILPSDHMSGHACQIDYIQTIWGDHQDHM